MAYTHSKYEVMMLPHTASAFVAGEHFTMDLTLATTVDLAHWAPGIVPHIIRGVGCVFTVNTTSSITVGGVEFQHAKPVFTATDTATVIAALNFPTTLSLATTRVLYKLVTGQVIVNPGEGVRARTISTVATTGIRGQLVLYVEPKWETPTNIGTMIQST